MKLIYAKDSTYIIRVLRGEEAVEEILSFCQERDIRAGWIQGLGAADKTEISYYDLEKQEYIKKTIDEECEILNLTGNIAIADNNPILHAHVTLGKKDYTTVGGHLHSMRISGTGEFMITHLRGELERSIDEETGLNLLRGQ